MKRAAWITVLVLAASTATAGTPGQGPVPVSFSDGPRWVENEILVKFRPGFSASARSGMVTALGFTPLAPVGRPDNRILRVRLDPTTRVGDAMEIFSAMPDVEVVQPNYYIHPFAVPNDPQYAQQWGFRRMNNTGMDLEPVWDRRTDCRSVVVAVIDTGVHYGHGDLAANMWTNPGEIPGNNNDDDGNGFVDDFHGYDFLDADGDPLPADGNDHGTHVAGTIAAAGNNNTNGTGVCWQARIMAVRVLGTAGGTAAELIAGIDYAVANGAHVINLSLGAAGLQPLVAQALDRARARDVVVVAAAGNDGTDNDTSPVTPCSEAPDNIVCVAALDQTYALAGFSNYGAASVDVGAPGTGILSTIAATVTDVDLSQGWTINSGWTMNTACSEAGNLDALADPVGRCNNPNLAYADNADDRIYRVFDMDQGGTVMAGILVATTRWNLGGGDEWTYGLDPGAGSDPFDGAGDVAYTPRSGSDNGQPVRFLFPLGPCVGVATCGVGFRLVSDAANTGPGVLIYDMSWLRVLNNSTGSATFAGTSMAAPHVAGLAALLRAHNPGYTYAQVIEALTSGGETVGSLAGRTRTGRAVNAWGSFTYITRPRILSATVTLN